jgi:hypothetical protein
MNVYALPGLLICCLFSMAAYAQPAPVVLHPVSTDSYVLKPSDYNPDNSDESKWIHQSLGNIKRTSYSLAEKENGDIVIEAVSENSASGLVVPIRADTKTYPIIEWSWWIESVLEKGDLTRKDGDDYPARIYITFDYPVSDLSFGDRIRYRALRIFTSFDVPTRAINYIWANKADVGTIAPNPFTDWVQMIAVQSGNEKAGTWQVETRNIYDDYREAFGEEPPPITGIQIMTDSDNTNSSARAKYGSITLRKQ